MKLTFVNPITNQNDFLDVIYPEIDYFEFKSIHDCHNDNDLSKVLDELLEKLNCTIEYNGSRLRMTSYSNYKVSISFYYFYLIKLTNQILYNKYIDKLIQRHIDNIIFEYEHPYIPKTNKKRNVSKKKNVPANKFIKLTTHNLFTNEKVYEYYNPRTKETIKSNNPNLLDELNASKKKERKKSIKVKQSSIPISNMTFSFKKK